MRLLEHIRWRLKGVLGEISNSTHSNRLKESFEHPPEWLDQLPFIQHQMTVEHLTPGHCYYLIALYCYTFGRNSLSSLLKLDLAAETGKEFFPEKIETLNTLFLHFAEHDMKCTESRLPELFNTAQLIWRKEDPRPLCSVDSNGIWPDANLQERLPQELVAKKRENQKRIDQAYADHRSMLRNAAVGTALIGGLYGAAIGFYFAGYFGAFLTTAAGSLSTYHIIRRKSSHIYSLCIFTGSIFVTVSICIGMVGIFTEGIALAADLIFFVYGMGMTAIVGMLLGMASTNYHDSHH